MSEAFDQELLVAYVDGELSLAEAQAVEALLARNPAARAFVRDLREGAALLRGSLTAGFSPEVPPHLRRIVEAAIDPPSHRSPRRFSSWGIPRALAAGFAVLVVGLGAGVGISEYRLRQMLDRLEAYRAEDRRLVETAVGEALEKHLSGVPVEWTNPRTGDRGRVTPIRTFRNAEGQWCREYEEVLRSADGIEQRRGIACRAAEGGWKTRLRIEGDS
jgi:surface antigen